MLNFTVTVYRTLPLVCLKQESGGEPARLVQEQAIPQLCCRPV